MSKTTNLLLALILLLSHFNLFSQENPFDEAKFTASFTSLTRPNLHTKETDLLPYQLRSTYGATFIMDLPIYRYLHSGFLLRYLASPKKGDIGGILDLGGVIKPMLGFGGRFGHVAAYFNGVAGFSVTFMPIVNKAFPVVMDDPKEIKEPISKHVNVFGGLLNASAKVGVEYFPFPQFGLFAEGGYGYWYFLHQIDDKLFEPTFKMFSYHLTGIIADAGIKYIF
jgi:hypothetical protein